MRYTRWGIESSSVLRTSLQLSSKLNDPFIGPFPITRVSDHGVNVWLNLPRAYSRVHQPFHVEKVKRYTPSVIPWGRKQDDRPLPEVIDGEEEWEVEMLLGKRQKEELVEVEPEVEVDEEIAPPSTSDRDEGGGGSRSSQCANRRGGGRDEQQLTKAA